MELPGFEKERYLEISKMGMNILEIKLEFAITQNSQSFKGIYRLLTDADGLAAVEELEVVMREKKTVTSRFET